MIANTFHRPCLISLLFTGNTQHILPVQWQHSNASSSRPSLPPLFPSNTPVDQSYLTIGLRPFSTINTQTIDPLYSNVPVIHDSVTVIQHTKHQTPESDAAKWNLTIISFIIHTHLSFSCSDMQNIFCEKSLLCKRMSLP